MPTDESRQLLTIDCLAKLLHRSPEGLRVSLYCDSDFSTRLRSARVKLGRRVYFRRDLVDQMIIQATGQ